MRFEQGEKRGFAPQIDDDCADVAAGGKKKHLDEKSVADRIADETRTQIEGEPGRLRFGREMKDGGADEPFGITDDQNAKVSFFGRVRPDGGAQVSAFEFVRPGGADGERIRVSDWLGQRAPVVDAVRRRRAVKRAAEPATSAITAAVVEGSGTAVRLAPARMPAPVLS